MIIIRVRGDEIVQSRRRPSPGVVDALATALRLTDAEHGRLRVRAGFAAQRHSDEPAPASPSRPVPREVTPAARRMLDRLTGVPACVCDATWTVLEGNDRWKAFGCPLGEGRDRDRNGGGRRGAGGRRC